MKTSKISPTLKWISGGLEALLGIPLLGGTIVVSLFWTPLMLMAVLHIITLIVASKEKENIHGSIIGIITSVFAWIPILGMVLHITSAIVLMVDAAKLKGYQDVHDDSNTTDSIIIPFLIMIIVMTTMIFPIVTLGVTREEAEIET